MKKILNPKTIQKYAKDFPASEIFSNDYTNYFELLEFNKKEFVLQEGMQNDYLLFLMDGTVKCFTYSSNGSSQFISCFRPFEPLGLVGSIWRKPVTINIMAIQKCHCLALSISRFQQELLDDNKFLRYLCKHLGETLHSANQYLLVSQSSSAESKLAAILLASADENYICHLNLSLSAEIIGTTYRHLLRMLNKLCINGVLHKSEKNYRITNLSYISRLAEDSKGFLTDRHFHLL